MTGNGGAWGVVMWKDGRDDAQLGGIALEGGDAIVPDLPTTPLGCLVAPPDGLGVPPVRSGDVAFAQRDGVVQFGDYYEPRQITLQVSVENDGCPGCDPDPTVDTFLLLNGVAPGRARSSDKPAYTITGDLDVRVHAALDDWTPAAASSLITQSMTTGNQIGWRFTVVTSGMLRLAWSANGSTVLSADSTVAPTVANGAPLWVRATIDVDNGAAGRSVRFYTSTDGVTWTQLGTTVTTAGVTSIFNSNTPLNVGSRDAGASDRMAGKVYSAEVYNGIDGTLIANPDFTEQGVGTTIFKDSLGNTWEVFAPATISGTAGTPGMSARQKVKRLTNEWSRNCEGATLVIFPDCYNPDADQEEKQWNGPYLVHGRPRVADIAWRRSDVGGADITLRFDCEDARLRLAVENSLSGTPWHADHTVDAPAGAAAGGNMAQDYRLDSRTMTLNGATVVDSHFSAGAPDGGSYFNRIMTTANTTSPMVMVLSGAGTGAIPVVAGNSYTTSYWARRNPNSSVVSRVDGTWYTGAGAVISTSTGTSAATTSTWTRFSQTFVAPATAAFFQPSLNWVGTAAVGQSLDFAQAWVNLGVAATSPQTVEVVGDLCVFPVITLFGTLNSTITVHYGPNTFTYEVDVTDSVVVDTKWGRAATITVDTTQNLSGNYTTPLAPGTYDFSITTGSPSDNGSARLEWSNSVVSG